MGAMAGLYYFKNWFGKNGIFQKIENFSNF